MNESIEILKRMLTKAESLPDTAENREAIRKALTDAIEALAQKERASKPSESSEVGLTQDAASEHLFRLSQGLGSNEEERRASAVNTLVGLTWNVPSGEDGNGPVNDLARLVRQYD